MKHITTLLLVLLTMGATAQDSSRKKIWTPHHVKLQYAGNIGFISAGAGYTNRKDKLEGDVYYGYVPESVGGVRMHILTGKLTWLPVKAVTVKGLTLRPLTAGLTISYTFGDQYFFLDPEKYPFNYYKFPTALTAGPFIGGQVSRKLKQRGQALGLYYEVGTTDKELNNWMLNRTSIAVTQILHLGLGIKWTLR